MIDLTVPEYKRTDEWWKEVIRFCCRDFNRPLLSNNLYLGNLLTQAQEDTLNWNYYYADTTSDELAYIVQGTKTELINRKNNQIFTLLNSLEGKISEFVDNYTVEVDLLSENAKSRKDEFKNLLLLRVEHKEAFDYLAMIGLEFNPIPQNVILETTEDVEEYINSSWRDFGCIVAERIAQECLHTNRYKVLRVKEFINLLVCGRTSTDRIVKNGKVVEEVVNPSEIIADLRTINDDNYNSAARYRGRFKQFVSPSQVLEEYGEYLSDEAKDEIKSMSERTANSAVFSNFAANNIATPYGANYAFYSVANTQDAPMTNLSVVKIYIILEYSPRLKEKKGLVVPIKDYNVKGELIEDNANLKGIGSNYKVAQATMIGGKYIVQKGWVANAVYDKYPMNTQAFPQTLLLDSYNNGIYRSRVSRMRDYLKDIWICDTRITQAMEADLGVNFFLKYFGAESNDVGGKTIIQRIYDEFKASHLSATKIDPEDPTEGNRQSFEIIDYTKSLSVVPIYQQIKNNCFIELQRMMHLPEIAQGIQERTVGQGEQQQTIATAEVGLMPLMNGFINYIQQGLQLTCNIQKLVWCADNCDQEYVRRILGDGGYDWLLQSVYEDFEILGIYINPYNVIDDRKRAALNAKLLAYAQNGIIDPLADLQISTMNNYREAINFLKNYFKKREREQKAAAEQQRLDNLAVAAHANETQMQKASLAPQSVVEATKIKADANKYQANVSAGAKVHDTNTNANVKLATHEAKL